MQESMSCWIPRAGSSSRRETIWNFRSSVPWEKRGNLKLLYSSTQAYFLRFLVRGSCWLEQIVTILWYQVNKMCTPSRTIHLLDCVGKNINDFSSWITSWCPSGDGVCRQNRTTCALLHRREFGRVLVHMYVYQRTITYLQEVSIPASQYFGLVRALIWLPM